MAVINQEPLNEVLGNYDISVLSIKNESYKDKKGVWWIQTTDGYKILKKISNSEDTLKYIISAVRHLIQNGIKIPGIIKTKSGNDYVNINGTCYVLSDAISGKTPSYDSSRELMAIIRELARFHRAAAGFHPLEGTKPKNHLGIWVQDYTEQIEDMNRFYRDELSVNGKDSIGKFILNEFPYFNKRAYEAIEALKGREYSDWVEKAGKIGCLCHQDFAAGNLIMTPNEIYILDTDSITIDIPARDIRKILHKIMKKSGKWDMDLTRRVLDYYQSQNPLTQSEWQVVKMDIMFPHLFIGAMNKYYYQRDKEWSPQKYLQRLKEMAAFEKTIAPLLDNYQALTRF